MKFVKVPGTEVLFCVWETRVRDYEAFVKATGASSEKPNFEQGPTHPAVNVELGRCQAFCAWLTKEERKSARSLQPVLSPAHGRGMELGGRDWGPRIQRHTRSTRT